MSPVLTGAGKSRDCEEGEVGGMDLISPVMKAKRSDPRSSILRLLASLASFWLMLPLLLLLFIALSTAPSMAAFCCCGCAQKTHRQLSTYNNSLNTCECAPKNHSYAIRDSALMDALKTKSCTSGFCSYGCSQKIVMHIRVCSHGCSQNTVMQIWILPSWVLSKHSRAHPDSPTLLGSK